MIESGGNEAAWSVVVDRGRDSVRFQLDVDVVVIVFFVKITTRRLIGGSDGPCGRTMRTGDNIGTLSSPAAAVCWLMGIVGVLTSVAAGSGRHAARRHVSPARLTSSTADLPWPTAIAGQFLLPQFHQLIANYFLGSMCVAKI